MTENSNPTQKTGSQWTCLFCGYVYDEAEGDPEQGIAPGTPWEDIPEDWCCPVCSAEKNDFSEA
jgi:rubredoxin---NAD+ reductase